MPELIQDHVFIPPDAEKVECFFVKCSNCGAWTTQQASASGAERFWREAKIIK
jgi:hypothetical protein